MLIGIIIIVLLYFGDQATKLLVEHFIGENKIIDLIPNFLYFTKTYNTGAAWSSLSDATWFLAILSFIATIFLAYFFTKIDWKNKKLYSTAICLCIAGCYGNFIDRLLYCLNLRDGVVDFIGVYIFNYSFPIFNVADICLTIGMVMIAIDIIFFEDKRKNKNAIKD